MLTTMKYDLNNDEQLDDLSRSLKRDGYYVLKDAVDADLINNLLSDMDNVVRERTASNILYQQHGSGRTYPITDLVGDAKGVRLVDLMVSLPSAQKVLLSEKVVSALLQIFDKPPVLFQSLSFEYGSQQALHQDTAYVVTNPPMNLVGVWIALEDIKPGSGELLYAHKSHNLPYFFQEKTNKFHWNRDVDGDGIHEEYIKFLQDETCKNGMHVESFLPEKGDALIWHSQLAHGGSKIIDENLTRKSIVGHFCPLGTAPNWLNAMRQPKRSDVNPNAYITSQY